MMLAHNYIIGKHALIIANALTNNMPLKAQNE